MSSRGTPALEASALEESALEESALEESALEASALQDSALEESAPRPEDADGRSGVASGARVERGGGVAQSVGRSSASARGASTSASSAKPAALRLEAAPEAAGALRDEAAPENADFGPSGGPAVPGRAPLGAETSITVLSRAAMVRCSSRPIVLGVPQVATSAATEMAVRASRSCAASLSFSR